MSWKTKLAAVTAGLILAAPAAAQTPGTGPGTPGGTTTPGMPGPTTPSTPGSSMPGPTTETTAIRMTRSGKVIHASTNRCMTRSNRPPR